MTDETKAQAAPEKKTLLQTLAFFGERRSLVMLGLGFASGLPFMLIFDTLSLWLRDAGLSLAVIGFFSLATLSFSFKFLWAPLIDRTTVPVLHRLLGHRRAWMLVFQTVMVLGLWTISTMNPLNQLGFLAAALLHLSQSAVSHALARLREQLGDPLFVREGRGVAPTPLAEQLAPGILDALAGLQRSVTRVAAFDPLHDRRSFNLNMPEQMEPLLLPAICAHLQQHAPQVQVRSTSLHWAELRRELALGRVDLAVEIARPTDAQLRQQVLLQDPLCVMVGPGFSGELTAERYLACEHVAVTSRRRGICVEDLALGHLGLARQVRQRCQHYLSAALLVAHTPLLLSLPRRYAELLNAGLGNRLLDMPLALPPVTLNLYWSVQAEAEPGNRWLRQQVLALAAAPRG